MQLIKKNTTRNLHLREECVAAKRQTSTYADDGNVDKLEYPAQNELLMNAR